jgi:hypothetical protein
MVLLMNTTDYLKGYSYGSCRLLGHAWHEVPSDWTPTFGVPMTVRCERCDMERRDSVHRSDGTVLSRRYTYPTGYTFTKRDDVTVPRRDDFRLAWINDAIAKSRQARRARAAT